MRNNILKWLNKRRKKKTAVELAFENLEQQQYELGEAMEECFSQSRFSRTLTGSRKTIEEIRYFLWQPRGKIGVFKQLNRIDFLNINNTKLN